MRLTLSTTPFAEPGLWRLQMTVHSFIRLVRKEPRMFSAWRLFMCNFNGNLFSGPFSQLVIVLNQVGWKIEPSYGIDHDGCAHHL